MRNDSTNRISLIASYILFSHHKESQYFAFDFTCPVIRCVLSDKDYLNQFDDPRHDYLEIGEGSNGYIFFKEAVSRILEFSNDQNFILAVRNPVDMAIPSRAQMLKSGHEDVESFAQAWRLSPERAEGRNLPKHRTGSWHACYQNFGCVGTRLEWLQGKLGRDRLKVVVFDDMVNNPRAVYLNVLEFLGVPDDGWTSFDQRNPRRYHRFRAVANFVNRPPRRLVVASQYMRRTVGLNRLGLIDRLRNWNLHVGKRSLDDALTRTMQNHYRAEVEKLETLLERRLGWFCE